MKECQIGTSLWVGFKKSDCFIITCGLYSDLVNVMHEEFEKMFHVPIQIDLNAKASLVSFPPEQPSAEYVFSEEELYIGWSDRNPL